VYTYQTNEKSASTVSTPVQPATPVPIHWVISQDFAHPEGVPDLGHLITRMYKTTSVDNQHMKQYRNVYKDDTSKSTYLV